MKKEENTKIKILHVIQSPGGVERYIQSFLKYIDHEKFYNILVCSNDYKKEKYIDLADEFENVDMVRKISLAKDFLAIIKVRKLINKYKPDIVFCHSSKAGAIGRIADVGIANKCIYNPHGWAFNMGHSKIKKIIYAQIEKMLAPLSDLIICISDFEQKSAVEHHICKKEKTLVIYNGIDFEEYENNKNDISRKMLGISEEAVVIGFTGRLTEQKAPDVFVRAAAIIKKKIPTAFFLIVGDGELRKNIENEFEKVGLENDYKITGWVSNPMNYILLFDIATLLSRWEGFGLVLAEYMLAEKPIVATNVDAIGSIVIDNVNGELVDKDDYQSIASQIIRLYYNQEKKKKYVTMGKKIVYERYNIEKTIKNYMKVFEKIK